MDALLYPENPPLPETAKDFLESVGSKHGIKQWCESKQAIPPRDDVSIDDEFTREQIRQFEGSGHQVPSIAHGLAVEPEVLVDLEVPFSKFTAERDVDVTTDELVSVFGSI